MRYWRILTVTLLLIGSGAVFGAVLGVFAMAFIALVSGGPRWLAETSTFFDTGAAFGACVGAVLAPAAGWLLMRHVPLWRAIGETALGTVTGVVLGFFLGRFSSFGALWPIGLGVIGFVAAAVRLRVARRWNAHVTARVG